MNKGVGRERVRNGRREGIERGAGGRRERRWEG